MKLLKQSLKSGSVLFLTVLSLNAVGAQPTADAVSHAFPDYVELARQQSESVVFIEVRKTPLLPSPQAGKPAVEEQMSHGSGFVIDAEGFILTNAHVVKDAQKIRVRLPSRKMIDAVLLGADDRTDIAVLKVDAKNLKAVVFGDSEALQVGEPVAAIGAPFGLENSVTSGIVSAKGRNLADQFVPFIQTDAAVNPGNSGGPLFNMKGEVVGVNSQIYTRSGAFSGLSFAIPAEVARDIAEKLKAGGTVNRGKIGVVIQALTEDLAPALGLEALEGALIVRVEKNGPADRAGIRAGDVILKAGNKVIQAHLDLPRFVAAHPPETTLRLTVSRMGQLFDTDVELASLSQDEQGNPVPQSSSGQAGLALRALTERELGRFNLEHGLYVEAVQEGSIAALAGLAENDILLMAAGTPLESLDALDRVLDKKERAVAILVRRGASDLFVVLKRP